MTRPLPLRATPCHQATLPIHQQPTPPTLESSITLLTPTNATDRLPAPLPHHTVPVPPTASSSTTRPTSAPSAPPLAVTTASQPPPAHPASAAAPGIACSVQVQQTALGLPRPSALPLTARLAAPRHLGQRHHSRATSASQRPRCHHRHHQCPCRVTNAPRVPTQTLPHGTSHRDRSAPVRPHLSHLST